MKKYTAIELLQQGKKVTKDEWDINCYIFLNNNNKIIFRNLKENYSKLCNTNDLFQPIWHEYKEYKYPIYMLAHNLPKHQQYIVKFTSLEEGIVIAANYDSNRRTYCKSNHWVPHTDEIFWKEVTNPNELCDKDLIWCWDDWYTHSKHIKFYDIKNLCTFSIEGKRKGKTYNNYKKILPWDYPNWVTQELIDSLED